MKGNNLVVLRGHLGSDPEAKDLPSGKKVELNLATNSHWRDGEGHWKERTDWHRIDILGPRAEWAQRALRRGDHVLVFGALRPRTWQQPDGTQRSIVVVRAWEVQCLTPRQPQARCSVARQMDVSR